MIGASKRVVFFGGAGVSTESGIPDFRSKDGLYRMKYDYPPEEILSHRFFQNNPREFYRFYYDKMIGFEALPSTAHRVLAKMERTGKLTAVVTQNIDGLHQAAGSKRVYELHGSVARNRCTRCGKAFDLAYLRAHAPLPLCDECGGLIKPDVVLYGESLDDATVRGALDAIRSCDLLIVGGTSLSVYPAAGMIEFRGGRLAVVNRDPTPADERADLILHAPLGEVFSALRF